MLALEDIHVAFGACDGHKYISVNDSEPTLRSSYTTYGT